MWKRRTNNEIINHLLVERGSASMCFLIVAAAFLFCGRVAAELTFGTPQNLGPVINSPVNDFYPSMSSDGLELYFSSQRSGGYGGPGDLWRISRATTDDDWGEPNNLGPVVNSQYVDGCPSITSDGLSLFFNSNRSGGYGNHDIYVSTRSEPNQPWEAPTNLGYTVNSADFDASLSVSADGLSLYFTSTRPDGYGQSDIYVIERATTSDPWGAPVNLGPTVNTSRYDVSPYVTPDGLMFFFASDRPGYGDNDLWVSTRSTKDDDWGQPVNLGPTLNTAWLEDSPRLSSDGSILYFVSDRPGGSGGPDLWQVSIYEEAKCGDEDHPYPIGDLNMDCIVNMEDLAILCEHWLEDNNPYPDFCHQTEDMGC